MLEPLADLAYRHATRPTGVSIPRVSLYVAHETSRPTPTLYRPMLCIVLRGAKRVLIGDRVLRYDTDNYFLGSVELPAASGILEASRDMPYVASSLAIDQAILADLIAEMPPEPVGDTAAFGTSPVTAELAEAWSRMLRLLDAPEEIAALAPLVEREVLFRILKGPQGALLRQAARADSRIAHLREAINHLRINFDRVVRGIDLAAMAIMSAPTFHRHFRAATAMSPLQFQKTLRLQEARRRLIAEQDTASAAHAVGYESTSQFSRDYARMFGAPPGRDAARLRAADSGAELQAYC